MTDALRETYTSFCARGLNPQQMADELGVRRAAVYKNLQRFGLSPGHWTAPGNEAEKWCPQCRSLVPREMFGPNRSKPDGLASWCRRCDRAAARRRHPPKPPKAPSARRSSVPKPRTPKPPAAPKPRTPKPPKPKPLPAPGFDDYRERWLRARIAERAVPIPEPELEQAV